MTTSDFGGGIIVGDGITLKTQFLPAQLIHYIMMLARLNSMVPPLVEVAIPQVAILNTQFN
jgi:hypothetical protein